MMSEVRGLARGVFPYGGAVHVAAKVYSLNGMAWAASSYLFHDELEIAICI